MTAMKRTLGPYERLADAIVAVAESYSGKQYAGNIGPLWHDVKKAVETQQQEERRETQARGKKPKLDQPIKWMGTSSDTLNAFSDALSAESVILLVTLRGYSVALDPESGTVKVVPLTAANTAEAGQS